MYLIVLVLYLAGMVGTDLCFSRRSGTPEQFIKVGDNWNPFRFNLAIPLAGLADEPDVFSKSEAAGQ